MSFLIRQATKEDAELIADLSRTTFYETFAASNTKENMDKFLSEQFTRGKLIREVEQPGLQFFIAYYDDEVAGYLKLRDGQQPHTLGFVKALEIARLYAMKTMIGKGVGALLMQKSIDIAKEKNKQSIWLGVWEKNQRALDFYRKWGFRKFSEQNFLLGNDVQRDWLMIKDL